MKLSTLGEFGFINKIKKDLPVSRSILRSIGDDCAVVFCDPSKKILLSTDMLLEGVHFTRKMGPQLIGRKAIACSLSDIAAMGGTPRYALVSLGVSGDLDYAFIKKIYDGMEGIAKEFSTSIVGGDTVKSKTLIINVAIVGKVEEKRCVYRSGAKRGDKIFVTGPLGGSLKSGRHLTFTPRVREAKLLTGNSHVNAMIDISDGLAADLGHILEESKGSAVIEASKIPRNKGATVHNALYDGEDFELLFTCAPVEARRLKKIKGKIRFYEIGEIISGKGNIHLLDVRGKKSDISLKGYTHF